MLYKKNKILVIPLLVRGYSSMVEQLYVAQYVPCSIQGIHLYYYLKAKIVQLVRTLISCIKNENSIFSLGNISIN